VEPLKEETVNTRRAALLMISLALAGASMTDTATAGSDTAGRSGERPNVIVIMADDHAQKAISSYSTELIQTPNIDRIAKEGIRFANSFVTNSICAPSRATLLTGTYSHVNGVDDNGDSFDSSLTTFPKLLREAGYQTAMIGKWHLKSVPSGFDRWAVLVDQGEYFNPRFIVPGDTIRRMGYATTLITDLAIATLAERDTTRPICLLYFHKAPHRNWMPDTGYLDLFSERSFPVPSTFHDDYSTRSAAAREADMRVADMYDTYDLKVDPSITPGGNSGGNPRFDATRQWQKELEDFSERQRAAVLSHYAEENASFQNGFPSDSARAEWKYQRYIKDYLRCIASIDDNIGRLLHYIDSTGLARNTVVIYTSDQGFYLGEHGWYDKRFMYEESMRTPLMIRYPREIGRGVVSSSMVLNLDLAPTILDLCGVPVPSGMQGRSLRGLFDGSQPDDWRTSVYYHYSEYPAWHMVKRHYGIRTGHYKLIHFYYDIDAWELYDLDADPHELHNVYDSPRTRAIRQDLLKQLTGLQQAFGDTVRH
jgi:arylsulfatase A-like enzyme